MVPDLVVPGGMSSRFCSTAFAKDRMPRSTGPLHRPAQPIASTQRVLSAARFAKLRKRLESFPSGLTRRVSVSRSAMSSRFLCIGANTPNPSSRIRTAFDTSSTATTRRPGERLEADPCSNLRCSILSLRPSRLDSTAHAPRNRRRRRRKTVFMTLAGVHPGLQRSPLYKAQRFPSLKIRRMEESIIASSTGGHSVGMLTVCSLACLPNP
jgi:hypothetical protein